MGELLEEAMKLKKDFDVIVKQFKQFIILVVCAVITMGIITVYAIVR